MRYAHTNIITRNWTRLADFYCTVFGCDFVPPGRDLRGEELDRGAGLANAHLRGAHLRLPGHGDNGPTLEIFEYTHTEDNLPAVANRVGIMHLAFEVDDVHDTLEQLMEHGGACHGEIVEKQVEGVGLLTFTYAKDPDGNLIELQNWRYD